MSNEIHAKQKQIRKQLVSVINKQAQLIDMLLKNQNYLVDNCHLNQSKDSQYIDSFQVSCRKLDDKYKIMRPVYEFKKQLYQDLLLGNKNIQNIIRNTLQQHNLLIDQSELNKNILSLNQEEEQHQKKTPSYGLLNGQGGLLVWIFILLDTDIYFNPVKCMKSGVVFSDKLFINLNYTHQFPPEQNQLKQKTLLKTFQNLYLSLSKNKKNYMQKKSQYFQISKRSNFKNKFSNLKEKYSVYLILNNFGDLILVNINRHSESYHFSISGNIISTIFLIQEQLILEPMSSIERNCMRFCKILMIFILLSGADSKENKAKLYSLILQE